MRIKGILLTQCFHQSTLTFWGIIVAVMICGLNQIFKELGMLSSPFSPTSPGLFNWMLLRCEVLVSKEGQSQNQVFRHHHGINCQDVGTSAVYQFIHNAPSCGDLQENSVSEVCSSQHLVSFELMDIKLYNWLNFPSELVARWLRASVWLIGRKRIHYYGMHFMPHFCLRFRSPSLLLFSSNLSFVSCYLNVI